MKEERMEIQQKEWFKKEKKNNQRKMLIMRKIKLRNQRKNLNMEVILEVIKEVNNNPLQVEDIVLLNLTKLKNSCHIWMLTRIKIEKKQLTGRKKFQMFQQFQNTLQVTYSKFCLHLNSAFNRCDYQKCSSFRFFKIYLFQSKLKTHFTD